MPRKSPENRAASYFRAGGQPPAAPGHLSPAARKLWQSIVAVRPPELFQPGARELLVQYCEMSILQQGYLARLRDAPDNPELQATVMKMSAALCQLATKLRLAQTSIDKRSGLLTETEPEQPKGKSGDLLYGGDGLGKVLKF
jgi:hypothetical protein